MCLCHNGRAGVTQKPSEMPFHMVDTKTQQSRAELPLLRWPLPGKLQLVSRPLIPQHAPGSSFVYE